MDSSVFNVRQYGATGDGTTKDTRSIQQAIDACAAAGGGRVIVPAGRYLSGTVYLKSHVELHLGAGATLVGSPNREDYNPDDIFPENHVFRRENVTGAHLIIAYCQENVSITGNGTIDGNSAQFFDPLPSDKVASYRFKSGNYPIVSWRPGQMVFFCRCRRVSVRDAKLVDSPNWNLFLLGCEDAQIRGLTIVNPPATQNGDGIDIDCSRNVTVSDCIIRSGDDCITIRANKRVLGEYAMPCENVTVTNCILSTPCNAIRIGVGDGEIRRCTFNNMVVAEARTAISIVSWYSESSNHGTLIEQVHFADFVVDAAVPIAATSGKKAKPPGGIRDVSFSRFRITAWAGAAMTGTPDVPMERIRLTDFDWVLRGGTDNCAFHDDMPGEVFISYHGMNGAPALPCTLYGAHLRDVVFDDVRIRWERHSAVWREAFLFDRSAGLEFHRVALRQPRDDGGAAIRCRESGSIALTGCRAAFGTDVFVAMERSLPEARIYSSGNDWYATKQPYRVDVPIVEAGNINAER